MEYFVCVHCKKEINTENDKGKILLRAGSSGKKKNFYAGKLFCKECVADLKRFSQV